jgi:hypothetical protein
LFKQRISLFLADYLNDYLFRTMSLNRVQQILQVDTSKTCTILSIRHFPGLARPEKQPLRRRPGTNITFPKVKKYDSVSKTIYGTETKVGMR